VSTLRSLVCTCNLLGAVTLNAQSRRQWRQHPILWCDTDYRAKRRALRPPVRVQSMKDRSFSVHQPATGGELPQASERHPTTSLTLEQSVHALRCKHRGRRAGLQAVIGHYTPARNHQRADQRPRQHVSCAIERLLIAVARLESAWHRTMLGERSLQPDHCEGAAHTSFCPSVQRRGRSIPRAADSSLQLRTDRDTCHDQRH
jgi:hypothetical protein